jgi:hypothetical protein
MRILFAMSSPEYLRFYDDTIVQLAERGHDVALAVNLVREGKPVRFDEIQRVNPRISIANLIPPRGDGWTELARGVRGTMDFVRYLHPQLAAAASLRARVKRQGLPWTLQWIDRKHSLAPRTVGRAMRALARIERAIPPAPVLLRFLEGHAIDLVLVSPLVEPGSDQVDIVRAAQARGIPVAALIASWDNLTNKGDLRVVTDLVAVWNDAQKREAVELHRIPADRIAVTGAQPFDRWFDRTPSRARVDFCRHVGLPDDRPFLLFTGSSIFIARAEIEMPFVRQWIEAVRTSADPAVRDLAILVRPHPYNGRAWNPDVCADMPGVAVWPRGGYDPVSDDSRAGLFDSLYHSAAVVGINTSAMIEAAIVGRPVFSIETPQFAGSQGGTLHYRHLLPENGGFLRVASSLGEHVQQLESVVRDPETSRRELARFVGAFIRPQGLDRPSTPILVDALERLGMASHPRPTKTTLLERALRVLLLPLSRPTGLLLPPSERKRARSRPKHDVARAERPLGHSMPKAVALALAVPGLLATLLVAVFVVMDMSGHTPLAYEPPSNLAEAAGMGLGADVLRFLRQGQDPRNVFDVRPDIISSSITRATGLEAAIWSRSARLVRLLERHGALDDQHTRRHLTCLARDIRADDLAAYLAANHPIDCAPGEASRLVEARSR